MTVTHIDVDIDIHLFIQQNVIASLLLLVLIGCEKRGNAEVFSATHKVKANKNYFLNLTEILIFPQNLVFILLIAM